MDCPICKKAGLDISVYSCPQCGSDLSQFKLLSQIEDKYNWSRKNRVVLIGVSVLATILSIFLFLNQNRANTAIPLIKDSHLDSVNLFREKYIMECNKNEVLIADKKKNIAFIYRVKRGDNLSKIAHLFYGDADQFEFIAKTNNLSQPYVLSVNQSLKIENLEK